MQRTCAIKKNRFSSFAWLFYDFFHRFFSLFCLCWFFFLFTLISLLPLFPMVLSRWYYVTFTILCSLRAMRVWTLYCVQFQFFWDVSSSYTREWRSIQLKKNDRCFLTAWETLAVSQYDIKTKTHLQKVCKQPIHLNKITKKIKTHGTWRNEDDKREIQRVQVKWRDRRVGK